MRISDTPDASYREYVATFFSHFGALTFFRILKKANIEARLMPVPRKLSSSCGTCVRFRACGDVYARVEDLEAVYICEHGEYSCIERF